MKKIVEFIKKNKLLIALSMFVICISCFFMCFVMRESDYFWHIKAGDYIFHNGVLKKDVFSWSVTGKYWMSHEWLFDLIIYSLSLLFPRFHILIYCLIFISTLLLFIFFSHKNDFLKNIPFSLLWICLSLIMIPFVQGRPHLISFNLLAITIYLLYDCYKNSDSKKIYLLPIIAVIWANVHGGSSNLVYLLCFIFMFGGLFNFNFSKIECSRLSKKQFIKYFVVAVMCMICININVHGFKMFIYPYQNMMDKTMLNNISEWAPTNLNNFQHYIYLLFVVIILMVMLFSKKKINFMDFILFGFCLVLGFKSIRFWAYTYIIMSFIIFNYIGKRKVDKGTTIMISVLSCLLIVFLSFNYKSINKQLTTKYLNDEIYSILRKEKPKRLYNMYDYGGELVYHDIKVFIDGRADLYSPYNFKDYLNISNLDGDYVKLIKKYDFDYFLVNKKYSIYTYLKYNDEYEVIYKNKKTVIFKKIK